MATKDKQLTTVALGDILPKIDIVTAYDASGTSDTAPWSEKVSVEKYKELKESITSAAAGGILSTEKGAANGVATLDSNGTVPSSQLPSYVDDVLEYASQSAFPTTGETGKIYVDTSTNKTYRWSGSTYVTIGSDLALGETSSTAYAGDKGAATKTTVDSLPTTVVTDMEYTPSESQGSLSLSSYTKTGTQYDKTEAVNEVIIGAATKAEAGLMTASDKAKLDNLNADTALSTAEKEWIEKQLFDSLFTGSISASPTSVVDTTATVTFTLTTKYDGTLVDLDSVPSGWTKESTGTYTKTGSVTDSTGASINSGSVTATYKGNSKTIAAASCTHIKKSYIYVSKTTPTYSDLGTIKLKGTVLNNGTSNSITGDKTVTITEDGQKVYFIISNTSILNNVQQLGLDYLASKAYFQLSQTSGKASLSDYKMYVSANTMAVGTQTVTVS